MCSPQKLSRCDRGSVLAPAGHGKTHLIAEAVASEKLGRHLILTHTHAGVSALKRRLASLGARASSYRVETIAGWALRYAASFPSLSQLRDTRPRGSQWTMVYGAARRLLTRAVVRDVIRCSYTGVYVDEYQDCTSDQHNLIVSLADVLPCRVLGDPLQGVFDFGNNDPVDWDRDVLGQFPALDPLTVPHRWARTNPRLGEWLGDVRRRLLAGQPVILSGAPVTWHQLLPGNQGYQQQLNACKHLARQQGRAVAIHVWPNKCHFLASRLQGLYSCVEPMDCDDLMGTVRDIESASGAERSRRIVDFVSKCTVNPSKNLAPLLDAIGRKRRSRFASGRYAEQLAALTSVADTKSLAPVLPALDSLVKVAGAAYRRELLGEMRRALREFNTGEYGSLEEAAWAARDRTRQRGRHIDRFSMGRTLLVKGLEFDHVVVLDADNLDAPRSIAFRPKPGHKS